jgi:hypothetical protein
MYVALFSNNSHSIRMKQFTIEITSLNCWRRFFPNLRLVANSIESRFRKAIKSIWKTEAGPMSHHLCQSGAKNSSSQLLDSSMAVPIREEL